MIRPLVIFALALPHLAAAEPSPRDRVLAVVPPDCSVCFVVQNLREQAKTVAGSPFAAWATEKIAPALGNNEDAQRLGDVAAFFERFIGVGIADIRDDILGDAAAFAYERGANPGDEKSMVVLHARDPAKLEKLIERLNALQQQAGELAELSERTHRGQTYRIRVREGGGECYFQRDSLFVLADSESSLKAAIERSQGRPDSPIATALADLSVQDAFLVCWLNPRKLDADLVPPEAANPSERAGMAQMARLWSAVDQCAVYLRVADGLELGISLRYRAEALPADMRPYFAKPPQASPLWNIVPRDAIFAAAVNMELEASLGALAAFLPDAERQSLRKRIENELAAVVGREELPGLFRAIGPEIGLWLEQTAADGGPLPAATMTVRIDEDRDAAARSNVLKIVEFYARLFVFDYNRRHDDHIASATERHGSHEAVVFRNEVLFPPGCTPAYAAMHGFLIITSRPTSLAAFQPPAPIVTTTDVPLARLSAGNLRKHLELHRDGLARWLAALHSRDESDIAGHLDTLSQSLEALDELELVVRGTDRSRTFALKARLVKPLR